MDSREFRLTGPAPRPAAEIPARVRNLARYAPVDSWGGYRPQKRPF